MDIEDYSRRNNVIVEGLSEAGDETKEQLQPKMQKLLKDKLNIEAEVEDIHRMGDRTSREKHRSVIVKMKNIKTRQDCLKAAPRLKGTSVYINEDVSKSTVAIRKGKLEELKEKRKQGFIAYFSGINIITKKRSDSDVPSSNFSTNSTTRNHEDNGGTYAHRLRTKATNKEKVKATNKEK